MSTESTERELYESGLSLHGIAHLRNIHHSTVAKRVRRQGGTLRGHAGYRPA